MTDVLDLRPLADDHTRRVIDEALDLLATLRGLPTNHPATRIHLITSLIRQAETDLTDAVIHAHDHGYTDTEIIVLLDLG